MLKGAPSGGNRGSGGREGGRAREGEGVGLRASVMTEARVPTASASTMAAPASGGPVALTWARVCKECGQVHEGPEGHLYDYQDDVDDELQCHICLQPLLRPMDTPCGHTYCYQCLSSFLRDQDFCPVDRQRLQLPQCRPSSLLVRNLLDKLSVLCPFHAECQGTMPRCELQPHLHNRSVPTPSLHAPSPAASTLGNPSAIERPTASSCQLLE